MIKNKLILLPSFVLLLCGCGSSAYPQYKINDLDEFNKLISFEGVEYLQSQSLDEDSRFEYAPNINKSYYYDGSQCVRVNNNGAVDEYNLNNATGGKWEKSNDPSPWDISDTIEGASPKHLLNYSNIDINNTTFNYDDNDHLYKGVSHLINSNEVNGDEIYIEFGFVDHQLSTFACYVITSPEERLYWYSVIYTYFKQIVPSIPDVDAYK